MCCSFGENVIRMEGARYKKAPGKQGLLGIATRLLFAFGFAAFAAFLFAGFRSCCFGNGSGFQGFT